MSTDDWRFLVICLLAAAAITWIIRDKLREAGRKVDALCDDALNDTDHLFCGDDCANDHQETR